MVMKIHTLTPDDDPKLDKDITHSKFLDSINALKHHNAPEDDHITSEDIISLMPHVLEVIKLTKRINILAALYFQNALQFLV